MYNERFWTICNILICRGWSKMHSADSATTDYRVATSSWIEIINGLQTVWVSGRAMVNRWQAYWIGSTMSLWGLCSEGTGAAGLFIRELGKKGGFSLSQSASQAEDSQGTAVVRVAMVQCSEEKKCGDMDIFLIENWNANLNFFMRFLRWVFIDLKLIDSKHFVLLLCWNCVELVTVTSYKKEEKVK